MKSFFREDLEDEDTALAFLYVSDDMEWGRKNLKNKGHKDLFFVGGLKITVINQILSQIRKNYLTILLRNGYREHCWVNF